jgi:hypothetical protein
MTEMQTDYEELPQRVKDNLSIEQWHAARHDLINDGEVVTETEYYINIRNGQIREHLAGDRADGPLLPVHDLSGAHGRYPRQFGQQRERP